MKTLLTSLTVVVVVAFGTWFLSARPPSAPSRSPLLALFSEPTATPEVCPGNASLVTCMEARWRAGRARLTSAPIDAQVGSALCLVGILSNRSLAQGGLWRLGCESVPWLPFEPCLTPRGWILMTRAFVFDDHPVLDARVAVSHIFDNIEYHRSARCPRIDRILPRVEDRPFERFAVGAEPVVWPEAATTRRASVG